jgi:hypothetical protein
MPDLVQTNVSVFTEMKLCGRGHTLYLGDMSHEGHAARAVLPGSESASDDRAKTVGTYGEACAEGMPLLGRTVAHQGSRDDTTFADQLLHHGTLQHGSTGIARRGEQLMVENPPRDR